MPPTSEIAGRFIGAAIAPAVLFTACALLLSGLQGKYSTLVSAMRTLNGEKRTLPTSVPRYQNVELQLAELYARARLIRNALFFLYSAILLLLMASVCSGFAALGSVLASHIGLVFFGGGMLAMVAAMTTGFWEARRAFEVVRLELDDLSFTEDEDDA
jgi:hypothetical protein